MTQLKLNMLVKKYGWCKHADNDVWHKIVEQIYSIDRIKELQGIIDKEYVYALIMSIYITSDDTLPHIHRIIWDQIDFNN